MATETTLEVLGLKELDELLKTLPAKIEGNVIRGAMRAGQNVIGAAAKKTLAANGNIHTGALQKSIRVRFVRKSEKKYGWVRANLIAGNKEAWYAHLIEFGTGSFYAGHGTTSKKQPYEIRPKNRKSLLISGLMREIIVHPGIKPQSFMRSAFDANNERAVLAFADYIRKRLPREIKKVNQ
jgi:HK97 gp10 family phage protein